MARLQFAVLLPDSVAPVVGPFTVTPAMPLPPAPLSVAAPASVIVAECTFCPDEWLVIETVGAVGSAPVQLLVMLEVRTLPAPSVAAIVNVLAPAPSV